jgi:hypothetical protein
LLPERTLISVMRRGGPPSLSTRAASRAGSRIRAVVLPPPLDSLPDAGITEPAQQCRVRDRVSDRPCAAFAHQTLLSLMNSPRSRVPLGDDFALVIRSYDHPHSVASPTLVDVPTSPRHRSTSSGRPTRAPRTVPSGSETALYQARMITATASPIVTECEAGSLLNPLEGWRIHHPEAIHRGRGRRTRSPFRPPDLAVLVPMSRRCGPRSAWRGDDT